MKKINYEDYTEKSMNLSARKSMFDDDDQTLQQY